MKVIDIIAMILLVIGGLNWGLYGAVNIDLVAMIFGNMTVPARVIYLLVGVAAVYEIFFFSSIHKRWCKY